MRHGNNDVVESVPVDNLRLLEKPPEVKIKVKCNQNYDLLHSY